MKRIGMLAMVFFASLRVWGEGTGTSVRVYAIEPASFDYVFASVMASSTTNPVLSFNHRGGRTFFVKPGESLGEYVVSKFTPVVTNVFNPSIKMKQEKKSGVAVLRAKDGREVELKLGEPLSQPGLMACLVNLADGNWWMVKEADTVVANTTRMRVGPVESNSVTLFAAGMTNQVPLISVAESTNLVALWESKIRKKSTSKPEEVAPEPEDDWVKQATAIAAQPPELRSTSTTIVRYPHRAFYGSIYSYPVEYQVVPGLWSSSGRMISPTIVLPRRFAPYESSAGGISVEYR